MRSALTAAIGLCLSSVCGACPNEAEQDYLRHIVISKVTSKSVTADDLDYVYFLAVPGASNRCIVVLSLSNGFAHLDTATISIFEISRGKNSWDFVFEQKDAFLGGSNGVGPRVTLVEIGKDSFALRFDGSSMFQGYSSSSVDFFVKLNGQYQSVFSTVVDENNSGSVNAEADPAQELDRSADLALVEGPNPQFKDIQVSYIEKRGNASGKFTATRGKTVLFRFLNGKYMPVEGRAP